MLGGRLSQDIRGCHLRDAILDGLAALRAAFENACEQVGFVHRVHGQEQKLVGLVSVGLVSK